MRAVIQRVSNASCTVDSVATGQIDLGLLVFLGVSEVDQESDAIWLAQKIANMRIFGDDQGLMNLSVQDVDGDFLVISQFTLLAQTKKGNRPSFIKAAKPEKATALYEFFIDELQKLTGKNVKKGVFGADMKIQLLNDGPVTIIMDTLDRDNH